MSILYESDNCVLISHENYINTMYEHVGNKGYSFNKTLFSINRPFKKQSLKRKTESESDKFKNIQQSATYIKNKFDSFLIELKSNNFLQYNTIDDNNEAINVSSKLYKESVSNLLTDTLGRNDENQSVIIELHNNKYLFPNNCTFYSKDVIELQEMLKSKYDLILLDPPWWNKAIRRKRAKTLDGYKMMYNDDLKEIPIESVLNNDGVVVVWCTNSNQHYDALINDIFPKWGVTLIAKWYWLKVTKCGEPIINFAEAPAKMPFEQIIIASRNTHDKFVGSSGKIIVSVPSALHSHKPPLVDLLKQYLNEDSKCLEIFARYLIPHWTSYGLEVLRLQNECFYEIN